MRAWLVVLLLLPAAAAQTASVDDAPDDVQYQERLTEQRSDAPQVYEDQDIVRAWIGNETILAFEVGLETVAERATAYPDPEADLSGLELQVRFSFGDLAYAVDFAECGEGKAGLNVDVEEDGRFSGLGCIDAVQEGPVQRAEVPKSWILDLDGIPVRAGSVLSDIHAYTERLAVASPVGIGSQDAIDEAPEEGSRPAIEMVLGDSAFGDLSLSTAQALRSSNGGPDAFVYPMHIDNRGDAVEVLLTATGVPDGWDVRVPARLDVPQDGIDFPVIVTTRSAHDHGTTQTFTLQAASPDATGTIELGIDFLAVPQLAGHHPRLYMHTMVSGSNAAGNDVSTQGWMNTLQDDPDDAGLRMVGGGGQSGYSNAHWSLPMDPALLIGMDFDTGRNGTVTADIEAGAAATDAYAVATLWHCNAGDGSGQQISGYCPRGSWFKLADGRSKNDAVDLQERRVWEVQLAPAEYADLVPYETGSNIQMVIEYWWSTPDSGFVGGPYLHSQGTSIELPLNEYKDPIDARFENVGSLRMVGDVYEKAANPGQSIWFPFTVHNNGGQDQDLQLAAAGHGSAWITGEPARVNVPAGGSADVAFRIDVPADAAPGEFVEAFLIVEDEDDPSIMALSQVRAVVTDQAVPEESAPEVAAPKGKTSPGLGALVGLVVVAAALRRR